MTQLDNGAKRLLEILTKAKDGSVANTPPLPAWGKVFGIIDRGGDVIHENEEFEVAHCLVELRQLINDIENQLRSIEGLDLELYLEPFPRIRNVCRLAALVHGSLGQTMNQLSPSDLTVLKFCANELSKHYSEPVVDEQWLKEFAAQVDALFDEVKESDLIKDLKDFLLKQLEIIRRAIQEYRIRGVERLKEALERVAGSLILHEDLIKKSNDKPEVGKFSKIFNGLVSIVTFASKATPLIGPAAKAIGLLLPSDPNAIPPVDLSLKDQ